VEVESFASLTEFAIAIAGFSGIVIALESRNGAISLLTWLRNTVLLAWALGAAFGSTFPALVSNFGATGPSVWVYSGVLLAGICFALLLVPLLAARRLDRPSRSQLSPLMWVLALGGNPAAGTLLLLNSGSVFGTPSPGPVYGVVLWLLAFATLLFARLLTAPPVPSSA